MHLLHIILNNLDVTLLFLRGTEIFTLTQSNEDQRAIIQLLRVAHGTEEERCNRRGASG